MSYLSRFTSLGVRSNAPNTVEIISSEEALRRYHKQIRRYQICILIGLLVPFLGMLFDHLYSAPHTEPASGAWSAVIAISTVLFFERSVQVFLYAILLVYILYIVALAIDGWHVRRSSVPFIAAHLFLLAGIIYIEHRSAVSTHQIWQNEMTKLSARVK